MKLLSSIINFLNSFEDINKIENESENKMFEEACKAYGLSDYAKEQCRKSGLSPKEWLKENEPDLYKELDD